MSDLTHISNFPLWSKVINTLNRYICLYTGSYNAWLDVTMNFSDQEANFDVLQVAFSPDIVTIYFNTFKIQNRLEVLETIYQIVTISGWNATCNTS